jgi:NADPH2:quinone reductase
VMAGTIPGVDGSGTIAAVGTDVAGLQIGDLVYAYSFGNPHGFYAEYVSVPGARAWHVPPGLDQKVAGAIPCVALTAQSGLEALKLERGKTLLVFGANGGVGSLTVWLAAQAGLTVIGTARADAHAYVRGLGAAQVIDPRSGDIGSVLAEAAPSGIDGVLLTAPSGDALATIGPRLAAAAPIAYPNGVEPAPQLDRHPSIAFDGEMGHAAFDRLNHAIGTRTIPLQIETFALEDVVAAHERLEAGHIVGKIVLAVRV